VSISAVSRPSTSAFIGGGLFVARRGLGAKPLQVVLGANLAIWAASALFSVRSSIILLTVGMVVWLALIPVIEAAEQTVLQRSIPFERQGRVFGFAQMTENAASPLTSLLMAPLASAVFMPTMTDGAGADLIGSWFGTGPERGLALLFTLAGLVGVVVTLIARASRSFRRLDATIDTSAATRGARLPTMWSSLRPRSREVGSRRPGGANAQPAPAAAAIATVGSRCGSPGLLSESRNKVSARSSLGPSSPAPMMRSTDGIRSARVVTISLATWYAGLRSSWSGDPRYGRIGWAAARFLAAMVMLLFRDPLLRPTERTLPLLSVPLS
jgi:hypothetical protein